MRTLVIIPTYDERQALPVTLEHLRRTVPEVDVLIVDDSSPDGTGQWAEEWAAKDAQVQVLQRAGKDGLGRAYLAGFEWAFHRGYRRVVEMDADGSHRAQDLPRLLAQAKPDVDLVIGSRWIAGGRVVNWPGVRRLISRAGSRYARLALGLRVQDATAGFRVYQTASLQRMSLHQVQSQGYCFQIDMTWRVQRGGGRIIEVPITFVERTRGESKMSRAIVWEAIARLTEWGIADRRRRLGEWIQALRRRA